MSSSNRFFYPTAPRAVPSGRGSRLEDIPQGPPVEPVCPLCGGPAAVSLLFLFDSDDPVYRCPTDGLFRWREGRAIPGRRVGYAWQFPVA